MALSEKLRACAERLANRPGDPEAVQVLESLLDAPAERVAAAQFLAPAYERAGNEQALERVLSLVATHSEAAADRVAALRALRALHARKNAWAALAEVTEKLAWVEPQRERALADWKEAATLHSTRLSDGESALEAWLRALAVEPQDSEARAGVRKLLEAGQPVNGAAAALATEILAKSKGHPEAQAMLDGLLPPTEALLAALGKLQGAAEPASMLDELHRLALRADALEEVADAVEAQSERVTDSAQVSALLRFGARVREELGQTSRAVALWNDLLVEAPRDAEALERLAKLLGQSGDTQHAGELSVRRAEQERSPALQLRHLIDAADYFLAAEAHEAALSAFNDALRLATPHADAATLARLQLERGRLLERSGDPAAVGALCVALEVEPYSQPAAEALKRALGKPLTRAAAAKALEPFARQQGDARTLAAVLAIRTENVASTEQHTELLVELAALNERLGEPRAALAALMRAFALMPSDDRVTSSLERLAANLDAKEELLAAYEERLDRGGVDGALARKVAELHEGLGNREDAFRAWERAAEANPRDVVLLEGFAEKARARGDLLKWGQALRWQINATVDPGAKVKLLRSLAHLCEDSLADPTGAAHAWEEVRELEPDDERVLVTLARLYEQTHHVAALAAVVGRQLELARRTTGAKVAPLALKLARLKLDAPTDELGALSLLREVLALEPENAQAVAALGRLASTPSPLQAEAAALAATALDKLGDYPVVVQILEAQLATTHSGSARAAILHRISDLQAGPLQDLDMAFLAITRALREAPGDGAVLKRCIELSDLTSESDALEALLAELGSAQPAGTARAGLFRALAQRTDGDAAIAAWSEVLNQAPHDDDARAALASLFEKAGRLSDLAVLQRQRAESAPAHERPRALLDLAAAQERAGELEEAASTLLGVFALRPGVEALTPLDRVLNRLGRHLERAEVLRRLAEQTPDLEQRLSRMSAQARALQAAGEPDQAVNVFAQMLALRPDEPRAVTELVALVSDASVQERVVELLKPVFTAPGFERQRASVLEALAVSGQGRHQRAFRSELAALHETLGDHTQAYAGRLRLLREKPSDSDGRAAIERLARAAHLEEELVEAYQELLEADVDHATAAALRETIGSLYARELNRPDLAVRTFEKLASMDRASVAPLLRLEELYRAGKDWVRLGDALRRKVPLHPDRAEQVAALRELAQLAEGPLKDRGLASECYRQILEREPQDTLALRALGSLLDGFGKHADAYVVLEQLLKSATDDAERLSLRLRLGRLSSEALGRPGDAVEHFAAALALRPAEQAPSEAVEALQALLNSQPSHLRSRIAAALEPVCRARKSDAALADMLSLQPPTVERLEELAGLRERLNQPAEAFAALQKLFEVVPEESRVRQALARVAAPSGQSETVASMLRARLEHRLPEEEAAALWGELGEICAGLGRRLAAAEAYEHLVQLRPNQPQPLEKLSALYAAEGVWAKVPALLKRRAELSAEPVHQAALLLECAEVCERRLHDDGLAIDACRAAVERGGTAGPALSELERLLEKAGRHQELKELLLQRADDVQLQVRIALVEHRGLSDDASALRRLKAVLNRDEHALPALVELMRSGRPSAAEAAKVVESLSREEWRVECLEVQAHWAPLETQVELWHRIADLHGADAPRAYEVLERILRAAPDDGRAFERLMELSSGGSYESALDKTLSAVADSASEATQRRIWPVLASVRAKLSDPAGALAAWQRSLRLDPHDAPALATATALAESLQQWTTVVELLERQVERVPGEARAAPLLRLAEVQRVQLRDTSAAAQTYRRLLELKPQEAVALERLGGLCEVLERWAELNEVLGRRIALAPPDADVLRLRLAQVRRNQLGNSAGALPLLGEILEPQPAHSGALAELEQLVAEQPGWEPAQDLLLSAHRRAKSFGRLAVVLDDCATQALSPGRRRALWLELSELRLSHDQDSTLAFLAMARAFKESPDDAALRDRLAQLAAQADESEAFGALLDEVMPRLSDRDAAQTALVHGELCLGALGEPEHAVPLLVRASQLDPSVAPRADQGLDVSLTRLQRWKELWPVLERRLQREGTTELLMRIGELTSERLDQPARAIEAFEAVMRSEPQSIEAARSLETLYERTGARTARLHILTVLEGLLSGVPRAQVRMKMARLCVKDDYERTLALCRKLLDEEPLHPEAFALLTERLESGGRWLELDQALSARLSATLVPQEAVDLSYRLGELAFRRRHDLEAGELHYRTVLARSPRHFGALQALSELYESKGKRRELADVLSALGSLPGEPASIGAYQLRRAELLSELEDPQSLDAVRLSLSAGGNSGSLDESTLLRLRAVTQRISALDEGAQVLQRLAELQQAGGQKEAAVATLLEWAEVAERRGDLAASTHGLERVLALEPSHRQAYLRAKELYAQQRSWPQWAALTAQFLPHLHTQERLVALDELVQNHSTYLKDPAKALGFALEAVRLDPGSPSRRAAAESLATRLKKLDVLARSHRETLSHLAFGPDFVALSSALATLEDQALDDVDAADRTLRGVLAHDPLHAPTLDALASMFERRSQFTRWVEVLELKLEAASDVQERAVLLQKMAELQETRLKAPGLAAQTLGRLVDLRPEPAQARLVVDLHRRHRQWNETLHALLKLKTLSPTPSDRAQVQAEIAQLHETELNNPDAAVEAFHEVLGLEPGSSTAFRALERLYLKLDRPAELLRAYEHRLTRTANVPEQIELHYKSAELWEKRNNPLAADRAFFAVVGLKSDELPALEGLCRLRRTGERWRQLTEALDWYAQVAPLAELRAALLTEQGAVFQQQLGDLSNASKSYARALEQYAAHRPALRAAALLHERERRYALAIEHLQREAALESSGPARADLECRCGELFEDALRDNDRATAAYQTALKAHPVHLRALRRLRALYFKSGNWLGYEENLAHEAQHAEGAADRYAAALELAKHLVTRAKAPARAVPWYEHALAAAPESVEAALPLTDLLVAAETWPRAVEVLKVALPLLEKERPTRTRVLVEKWCELAQAHRQLAQPALAVQDYARALLLDPTEPKALRAQYELLEQGGHFEQAVEKLELYLEHHSAGLLRSERAALSLQLGQLYWKLKREHEALLACERALDIEPASAAALALAAQASDQLAAHDRAIQFKQRLADVSPHPERVKLLLELASQAHQRLSNPGRAVEALLTAQSLEPQSKAVNQQLAAAYAALGHNRKAAEARLAVLHHPETTAGERRVQTLALADLYGRGMGEIDRAVDLLERALDESPQFVEAFQAVEGLLTKAKDYRKLDSVYGRMAARFGTGADTAAARATLWRATGELRLNKLKDRLSALNAFEQAVRLSPSDPGALESFAGLAIEFPDRVDDALKAYLRALPLSPDPQKACAAFARVAEKRGDLDSASIAHRAAAMYSPTGLQGGFSAPAFRRAVSDESWREKLLHPYCRGPLGELFALIWEQAGKRYARDLSDYKLHPKKHAVDPRTATHPSLAQLFTLGQVLGLPPFEVLSPYLAPQTASRREVHPDDAVAVKVVPTHPARVVVGERLMSERAPSTLNGLIGRGLASLRPELLPCVLLDGPELELMVEAALSLGDGRYVPTRDPKELKPHRKNLEKGFSSQHRSELPIVAEKVLARFTLADVARYREGARLTALRVALLLAGDFAPVRAQMSFDGTHAEAAMRELLVFALGGELHQLRVETGIAVQALK